MAAGTVSVATLVRAELTLLAEITTLEAREKELSTSSALRGLIEPGADVARRWETAPISTRREIARILLTPSWSDSCGSSPYPDTAGDAAHRPTNTPSGGEDDVERLVIRRPYLDCVQSNSPIPAVNAVHPASSTLRTGPDGSLLSRMARLPSGSAATSTQALPAPLRLDLHHWA